ncbi:crotonase/enoyl-CoA hydratase family protein [Alteromonas sp. a30]|uniref:crotonase/enoyl-CoA hydratase family protein n=1 Tax=Alteromonas sp. a30 TaxID=2730917 RepID=UPI00227DC185|nr:crotonase/enoyl-CoA hydratase family protein [Alteromonas sp. a30]MCY7297033.1 crotonase/enoyl-CoA hydratase family protein [Alteromonas sp. a30]
MSHKNTENRTSCVLLNFENDIAIVSLNRPDKHNALNMDMFYQLDKISKQLRKNKKIRAVIVTGEGVDFCSGLDIKSILKKPSRGLKLLWKWLPGHSNLAQRVSTNWRKVPVPVFMCIHGRCWGGGLQIALGGDFRIATPESTLSVMEAKWGLIPDMGGTIGMREVMALDQGLELAMTAKVIDAQEALENKILSYISDDPKTKAKKIISEITQNSPDAIAKIKQVFHQAWHKNDAAILARESFWQWKMLLGRNQKIAVKRHSGKPDLPYKDRS